MTLNVLEINLQTPDRIAESAAINNHNHDDRRNIDRVNWRGKTYNAPTKKKFPQVVSDSIGNNVEFLTLSCTLYMTVDVH